MINHGGAAQRAVDNWWRSLPWRKRAMVRFDAWLDDALVTVAQPLLPLVRAWRRRRVRD